MSIITIKPTVVAKPRCRVPKNCNLWACLAHTPQMPAQEDIRPFWAHPLLDNGHTCTLHTLPAFESPPIRKGRRNESTFCVFKNNSIASHIPSDLLEHLLGLPCFKFIVSTQKTPGLRRFLCALLYPRYPMRNLRGSSHISVNACAASLSFAEEDFPKEMTST